MHAYSYITIKATKKDGEIIINELEGSGRMAKNHIVFCNDISLIVNTKTQTGDDVLRAIKALYDDLRIDYLLENENQPLSKITKFQEEVVKVEIKEEVSGDIIECFDEIIEMCDKDDVYPEEVVMEFSYNLLTQEYSKQPVVITDDQGVVRQEINGAFIPICEDDIYEDETCEKNDQECKHLTLICSSVECDEMFDDEICPEDIEKIIITRSVKTIPDFTFSDCKNLSEVTFEDNANLLNIGDSAFSGCTSLTNITIPDGVTEIGASAFSYCFNLKSAYIPDSVTSIGESAFSGCDELEYTTIGRGVKEIASETFMDCFNLQKIYIPDSVIHIADYAFDGCSDDFTIHASSGSYAEQYAVENGINFVVDK